LFAGNLPPKLDVESPKGARAICYSDFAILHSGKTRTPIFVAERLNKLELARAKENARFNKFFADRRLPASERAELEDYVGSGYDRGHMAPAGDMSNATSMEQSFSLANIVPQAPINNRKAWASIEKATRKYVLRAQGDVFVLTGPAYQSGYKTIGRNRVGVPSHLFKLVYDPAQKKVWAHWLENSDSAKVGKPISYEELVKRVGVEFLPVLNRQR